jgi:ribulose-bisphosphate carboxylase large chain
MAYVSTATLDRLRDDVDAREEAIRRVVLDRLGEDPAPGRPDHFVAIYDFAFRTTTLQRAVEEIGDHATSVIEHPPKGSLLGQCSARRAGVDLFVASGRIGLLHVAFPLNHERS